MESPYGIIWHYHEELMRFQRLIARLRSQATGEPRLRVKGLEATEVHQAQNGRVGALIWYFISMPLICWIFHWYSLILMICFRFTPYNDSSPCVKGEALETFWTWQNLVYIVHSAEVAILNLGPTLHATSATKHSHLFWRDWRDLLGCDSNIFGSESWSIIGIMPEWGFKIGTPKTRSTAQDLWDLWVSRLESPEFTSCPSR